MIRDKYIDWYTCWIEIGVGQRSRQRVFNHVVDIDIKGSLISDDKMNCTQTFSKCWWNLNHNSNNEENQQTTMAKKVPNT